MGAVVRKSPRDRHPDTHIHNNGRPID